MKRMMVRCGLCGALVKLTKGGLVPEHPGSTDGYGPYYRRCNGLRRGINIALAATAAPTSHRWRREDRKRALRYHQAGKSLENDPAQRHRWLYRNGWLPAQLARQFDQVYPWNYQIKYGKAYAG